VPGVRYIELDQEKAALVQLFQFLIANHDHSLIKASGDDDCCHNIQVLGPQDNDDVRIPVPFDFDMSGLVNARYANPPSSIPIRDVRQRYFYGICQPQNVLDEAIATVQSKRSEIEALFVNEKLLSESSRKNSLSYINSFYAIIDNPKRVNAEIVARCRGKTLMERTLISVNNPT